MNSNALNIHHLTDDTANTLLDARSSNERHVLSLIRQHGSLSKSDIAQHTGLSAQSASVIIKKLEEDKLVTALKAEKSETPVKKKGQPKVPFSLNNNGAFGIGLKIGRRSYDMTLLDLAGQVRASVHEKISYPTVDSFLEFVKRVYRIAVNKIGERYVNRIQGIGVAMPSHIWQWSKEVNAPQEALAEWEHFDLQNALFAQYALPVFILNDAAAACNAELSFGNTAQHKSFLYVFVGTFLGGGVVINNSLIKGKSGNGGAIGSLPLLDSATNGQLMSKGSLYVLSQMLEDNNENSDHIYDDASLWSCSEEVLSKWCSQTGESIAFAAHCATCFLDLDGVIIDGAIPASVKLHILEATQQAMLKKDTRGTTPAQFSSGVVGVKAQSIGSASFPLSANYF